LGEIKLVPDKTHLPIFSYHCNLLKKFKTAQLVYEKREVLPCCFVVAMFE
jgi:hypothetical protein